MTNIETHIYNNAATCIVYMWILWGLLRGFRRGHIAYHSLVAISTSFLVCAKAIGSGCIAFLYWIIWQNAITVDIVMCYNIIVMMSNTINILTYFFLILILFL